MKKINKFILSLLLSTSPTCFYVSSVESSENVEGISTEEKSASPLAVVVYDSENAPKAGVGSALWAYVPEAPTLSFEPMYSAGNALTVGICNGASQVSSAMWNIGAQALETTKCIVQTAREGAKQAREMRREYLAGYDLYTPAKEAFLKESAPVSEVEGGLVPLSVQENIQYLTMKNAVTGRIYAASVAQTLGYLDMILVNTTLNLGVKGGGLLFHKFFADSLFGLKALLNSQLDPGTNLVNASSATIRMMLSGINTAVSANGVVKRKMNEVLEGLAKKAEEAAEVAADKVAEKSNSDFAGDVVYGLSVQAIKDSKESMQNTFFKSVNAGLGDLKECLFLEDTLRNKVLIGVAETLVVGQEGFVGSACNQIGLITETAYTKKDTGEDAVALSQKAIFHYFPALNEAHRKLSNAIGGVFGQLTSEGLVAGAIGDHFVSSHLANLMLPPAGSLEDLPELAIQFNEYLGNGSLEEYLSMTGREASRSVMYPLVKVLLTELNKSIPSENEIEAFMTVKNSTPNNVTSGIKSFLGW